MNIYSNDMLNVSIVHFLQRYTDFFFKDNGLNSNKNGFICRSSETIPWLARPVRLVWSGPRERNSRLVFLIKHWNHRFHFGNHQSKSVSCSTLLYLTEQRVASPKSKVSAFQIIKCDVFVEQTVYDYVIFFLNINAVFLF